MIDIHQIEMKFIGLEDRILMRVNSKKKEEIRFWMTRRFVKAFWPILEKMLTSDPSFAGMEEETQQAGAAFLHEQAMSTIDLSQSFQAGTVFPLGEEKILIVKITMRTGEDFKNRIGLHPEEGQGLEIERGHPILNYLYQNLPKLAQEAQWNLPLTYFDVNVKPDKLH